MTVEYTIRFEDRDLVCHLIVDSSDFAEVHRIPDACQDDDDVLCGFLIELCQEACERDAGQLLPWIFSTDDADLRVCWTGPLDRFGPVMLGSER